MSRGQLVPDELTIRLVRERTSHEDSRGGYILDGFPRNPVQANSLKELAREQGMDIVPVLIDAPTEMLEKRMTGRRNCPICGEIYNIYFKPPKNDNVCDKHPNAQLIHRADDNADTVRARLATFDAQTKPLIDYYRTSNVLRCVDGGKDTESIYREIESAVKN